VPELQGRDIGGYTVVSLLGRGGMGEVYRARDVKLGRDVAIKILPADIAASPERVARFEREARLLAALSHSHIGAIYGVVEDAGGPGTRPGTHRGGDARRSHRRRALAG